MMRLLVGIARVRRSARLASRSIPRRLFATWPARRIGLSVGADAIRAVGVRVGKDVTVEWGVEAQVLHDAPPLADQIARLLATAPRRALGTGRVPVIAVVGPSHAQAKPMFGIPPVTDPRVAADIVRESADRLFLRNGPPLLISAVHVSNDGDVWAAAFDRPTVESTVTACRIVRRRLAAILPSVAVAHFAVEENRLTVEDGGIIAEVGVENRTVARVHRRLRSTEGLAGDGGRATPVPPLASLGDGALRFAEAYGAAVAPPSARIMAVALGEGVTLSPAIPRWRAVLATGMLCVSVAAAALTPGVVARSRAVRAEARLVTLEGAASEVADAQRNLAEVTNALEQAGRFSAERRSVLGLLAALTAALPDESAIVTARLDSIGGTIVVLTPQASGIVARLDGVDMIASPELVGPVTRETVAGRDLERGTIRFRLVRVHLRDDP